MNILVNQAAPSGPMPAVAAAVPLASKIFVTRQPRAVPGEGAVVSEMHKRGGTARAQTLSRSACGGMGRRLLITDP